MARKSYARSTTRTIVGAARSSATHIQRIAVRAATAAANAAAAAAVEAVMKSLRDRETPARNTAKRHVKGARAPARGRLRRKKPARRARV